MKHVFGGSWSLLEAIGWKFLFRQTFSIQVSLWQIRASGFDKAEECLFSKYPLWVCKCDWSSTTRSGRFNIGLSNCEIAKLGNQARSILVREETKNQVVTLTASEVVCGEGRTCRKDDHLSSTPSIRPLRSSGWTLKVKGMWQPLWSLTNSFERTRSMWKMVLCSDETKIVPSGQN